MPNKNKNLKGLGGWLIAVQVGLYYILLNMLFIFVVDFVPIIKTSSFNGIYTSFFVFLILILVANILSLFYLYKKSKKFIILTEITFWLLVVISTVLPLIISLSVKRALSATFTPSQVFQNITYLAVALLVNFYFMTSKRVKNTFVK